MAHPLRSSGHNRFRKGRCLNMHDEGEKDIYCNALNISALFLHNNNYIYRSFGVSFLALLRMSSITVCY